MHLGDSSSGGGQSPLTARSLRLERVAQALAHSQEELRRYVEYTSEVQEYYKGISNNSACWYVNLRSI